MAGASTTTWPTPSAAAALHRADAQPHPYRPRSTRAILLDLFFFRLEAFGAELVDAIGTRPVEEPALLAFRRHLLESGGLLSQVETGDLRALERLRTVNRVIAASPALQAREQQAFARTAEALAALLAADTGAPPDDHDAQVVANALVGVQRALVDYTRRRVLSDEEPARLAADVRAIAQRAFALLEHGLGGYAPKPAPPCP
jgi:MftR C-terminal domain